jgi:AraC-like DNA-binding protein
LTAPSLHRLLDEFEALVRQGHPAAPDWAEARRAAFMAQRDQLLKARFLLACDHSGSARRPMSGLIDDLLQALRIFRANDRSAEAARCLARLCDRYTLQGLDLAALEAGRMALDVPDLHLDDRIRLLAPMCIALAHQMRMPAAWALIEEIGGALRRVSRDGEAWGRFDLARAAMHFIEAVRAARMRSIYGLDLSSGPPDPVEVERHLLACERLLTGPSLLRSVNATSLHALCATLRAQGERAVNLLQTLSVEANTHHDVICTYNLGWCLRVLERPAEALVYLERAAQIVAHVPAGKAQLMVQYDLAQCLAQLGRHEAAFEAMESFVHQRAALYAAETQALRRLEDASGGRAGGRHGALLGLTSRAAPAPNDIDLLRSEPPCLAQAERALVQQLPRRLSVQALAAHTGVSVRTLQQAARRFRGQTLSALLRQRLMQEALQWMMSTDLTLQDIAARCAYRDAGAFSRDFKRVHGSAPSVHRALLCRQTGGEDAPIASPACPVSPARG